MGGVLEGRVEQVRAGVVTGWAWRRGEDDDRVLLRVLLDGRELGWTVAELQRPSLAAAGVGDGRHGFRFVLPALAAGVEAGRLRVESDGEPLPPALGFVVVGDGDGTWDRARFTIEYQPAVVGNRSAADAPPASARQERVPERHALHPEHDSPPRALRPAVVTMPGAAARNRGTVADIGAVAAQARIAVAQRPWVWPAVWLGLLGVVWTYTYLVGISQSLTRDEALSALHYIEPGPSGFLFGNYVPNDHIIYEALVWAASSIIGRAEAIYRLGSIIPAGLAVAALAIWAWRRVGRWTAVTVVALFTFAAEGTFEFAQARGYGLALLAMAGMVIIGIELAERGPRPLLTIGLGLCLFVGIGTHPMVGAGAAGVLLALFIQRELRWSVIRASVVAAIAVLALFAHSLPNMWSNLNNAYVNPTARHQKLDPGRQPVPLDSTLAGPALLMSPMGHMIVEGGIDRSCGAQCDHGANLWLYGGIPVLLAIVAGVALFRERRFGMLRVLTLPLVVPFTLLAVGRVFVFDRYMIFLLAAMIPLVALGGTVAWRRWVTGQRWRHAALIMLLTALAVLGAYRVVRMTTEWAENPVENYKLAAQIAAEAGIKPIVTNSRHPEGLQYYLGVGGVAVYPQPHPVQLEQFLCENRPVVFIEDYLSTDPPDVSCLVRAGASHIFVPTTAGDHVFEVWIKSGTAPPPAPPADAATGSRFAP